MPHCAWWMGSVLLYNSDVFQACLCIHKCDAFKAMIWITSFKCSRETMCIHCVTPRFARNPCRRSYSMAPLRHNGKTSQDVHRCANSPTSTAKGTGVDKESMQPPLQLQIFNFFTCGSKAQLQPLASPTLQPWWNQESRSKGILQSPSKEHNLPVVAIFKR